MFSGSLKMNLDPTNQHTDDDLWEALEHAHLHHFVKGTPQKLEFDCGEDGQNLR